MEEQAGVYKITLYENNDLILVYSEVDDNTILSLGNITNTIEIDNDDCETQEINYSFEHQRSANNRLKYLNTISWLLIGLNDSNLDTISQLKKSIYGWIAKIDFYNGDRKIIDNPFRFIMSSIDNNESNSYMIELKNIIYGNRILNFGGLTGEIITADSDVVTADSDTVDASGAVRI